MAVEKWESAIGLLPKAGIHEFTNLCHKIAEGICTDGILSADKYTTIWSLEEWWQVKSSITDILRQAVGKEWTNEKLDEALGPLDGQYKKVISEVISVHRADLRRRLVQDTTAVSHAVLKDFDWKLKLSLASDKLASLQEPLLQLDLFVREANGERKQVFVELNKSELEKLILSLEGCSKSVQQLTTSAS
ncbi:COMM domain-containing protein 8-like [Physella acuta]|uniref:COMM domain-containing protein 8-like n=1 Tax=Physella acuta TaxID=109671 RepID=UPI0027DB9F6C|nr:COMM domain-containing protein 8-like [Physella acuta]